jgi:hypothetical protein
MSDAPPFCATRTCALHLTANDPRVRGHGEWAHLPSGLIVGRTRIDGQHYCDVCARDLNAGRRPLGLQ